MATIRRSAVTFKGNPVDLEGPALQVGAKAPVDFTLSANDLSIVQGKDLQKTPRIISTVLSLDTSVCDFETRRFNEEAARIPDVKVFTISMDLPFAQRRWCGAAGISAVQTLSDFKERNFGRAYGVWSPALGLLARAVFVVDKDDTLRHVEYVSEMSQQPNFDKALEAARKL